MGAFLSLPVLALAIVFQVTVIPQLGVLGGQPDLIFLLVVTWALNASLEQGITWAFVGGFFKDFYSAAPIGTSAFGFVIVVFIAYAVRQQMYRVGIFTLFWIILLGSFLQQMITIILLMLTGFAPAFADQLGYGIVFRLISSTVFPSVVYNVVVALPVYAFVRWLQRRTSPRERMFR